MSVSPVPASESRIASCIAAVTPHVNSITKGLVKMVAFSIIPSIFVGGLAGNQDNKPITFIVCLTMQELFWRYVSPLTLEPIFMNPQSNLYSRSVGLIIGYSANLAGSLYLTRYLMTQGSKHFPSEICKKMLQDETKEPHKPLLKRYAFFLSLIPGVFYAARIPFALFSRYLGR